jgi:hypothetical protein
MSTPAPHDTSAGGREPAAPAGDAGPPDQFAVSAAVGPLPAVYVPRTPGQAGPVAVLRRACVRALRLAGGWVIRRLGDGPAHR